MNRITIRIITAMTMPAEQDEHGAVAAEYGVLLAGSIAVVAIAAAALGGRIGRLFDAIIP